MRENAGLVGRAAVADARGLAGDGGRGDAARIEHRQARVAGAVLATARVVEERGEDIGLEDVVGLPSEERAVRAGDDDHAPVPCARQGD